VRWDSLGHHVRHQFVKATDIFAVEFEYGVNAVWSHRIVDVFPVEELRVKIFSCVVIAGSEFHPTKRAGFGVGHLLHSYFTHLDQSSYIGQVRAALFSDGSERGETFLDFWKRLIYHFQPQMNTGEGIGLI
jgi:hypothetical protein